MGYLWTQDNGAAGVGDFFTLGSARCKALSAGLDFLCVVVFGFCVTVENLFSGLVLVYLCSLFSV